MFDSEVHFQGPKARYMSTFAFSFRERVRSFLVDVCVVCCGVFQNYEVFVHIELQLQDCSAYFLSVVTTIVIMQFKHVLRFLLILSVVKVNLDLVIMLFLIQFKLSYEK